VLQGDIGFGHCSAMSLAARKGQPPTATANASVLLTKYSAGAAAIFLILLIVGLIFRNDSWIYSQIGWLDPWTYVGFGYSYDHPRFDADDYKIARLPWILAEYYTRHWLNPVASQYALQLGSLFLQGWFFYLAAALLFGPIPALIGATFLLTLPFIHGPGGADYNFTPSGTLYALSFYVLTGAARSSSCMLAVLFGICLGLLLHTNFIYINLLVCLAVHFLSLRCGAAKLMRAQSIISFGAFTALGLFAVTATLCLVNWSYGRQWLFFLNLAKMAARYLADSSRQTPWWLPWRSEWYSQEAYVGVLAAGLIGAAAAMVLAWSKRVEPATRSTIINLTSQYVIACAIWIFWQTAGHTALQPVYFAYPLWIPLAGVVSSIAAIAPNLVRRADAIAIAGVAGLAGIAPYSSHWPIQHPLNGFYASIGLFSAVFLGAVFLNRQKTRLGLYVFAFLLGPANAWVNASAANYRRAACNDRRDAQLALIAAHNVIVSLDPDFSRPVFVWRNPDNGDSVSMSTCSLVPARYFGDSLTWSGWKYLDDARPFKPTPEISRERLQYLIAVHAVIVMVTDDSAAVAQMRDRFLDLGADFDPPQQIWIEQGTIRFSLMILRQRR